MPNHYFQFKQFTVQQEHCAMKVTTDGCLFGAWAANHIASYALNENNILDIGAGTGLLSLMMAQKKDVTIDAVEVDEQAAMHAQQNFQASPWKERLQVHHTAIQEFKSLVQYDFIITNPPFFDNDLKSVDNKRNLALHSAELSLEELLTAIKRLLKNEGKFCILLPYHRSIYFEELAIKEGFYMHEKVSVRQTEKHPPFRTILLFGNEKKETIFTEIIIKENNQYSNAFCLLLKDYYLNL